MNANDPTSLRQDLIDPSVSGFALFLMIAVALGAWVGSHYFKSRFTSPGPSRTFFVVRCLIGVVTFWVGAQFLARIFMLITTMNLWWLCLIGGFAVEMILAFYSMERKSVSSRVGLTLVGLRLSLLALVLMVLAQPVFAYVKTSQFDRFVAVLIDDSASMGFVDPNPTPSELLQLARLFGVELPDEPEDLRVGARALAELHQRVVAQREGLLLLSNAGALAKDDQVVEQLDGLQDEIDGAWTEQIETQYKNITKLLVRGLKFEGDTSRELEKVQASLGVSAPKRLVGLNRLCTQLRANRNGEQMRQLIESLGLMATGLTEARASLAAAPPLIDQAFFGSLDKSLQGEVRQLGQQTRSAIAQQVLTGKVDGKETVLEKFGKTYKLRVYRFAAGADPVSLEDSDLGLGTGKLDRGATDLADALGQAQEDVGDGELAGVLIVTDGRHNTAKPVQPIVRKLGLRGVPVSTVVIGSTRAPADAAIVGVSTPMTVFVGDRVAMNASLKLDGFSENEQVIVRLVYKDGKVVDEKKLRIPSKRYRPSVLLSHRPEEKGIHEYRIELLNGDGTPLNEGGLLDLNNSYKQEISVTDERTKLLIVEGRSRWEFKYLWGLFASRDMSVNLQYVLTHPDRIAGLKSPARVHASVSRPVGQVQATHLPETEAEWLRFDVIVLGDVSPEVLDVPTQEILRKFVADRGGTLIVIAGANHMPHRYETGPLTELLPVTFDYSDKNQFRGPEPAFQFTLAPDGRDHIIMQQNNDPVLSQRVWDSIPAFYWRHGIERAKPGADVLAYAVPLTATEALDRATGKKVRSSTGGDAEREAFEHALHAREHALVVTQDHAAGKVMMLNTDRTWRLRYREGDTFHHKFWGQVLRWGTSDKLRDGTSTVRLGTDRIRYTAVQDVLIKAQLLNKERQPVEADDVVAKIFDQNDKFIKEVKLRSVPNTNGRYEGDSSIMPTTGTFRVVLGGKTVDALLSGEDPVKTEFLVAAGARTTELVDLEADRSLPMQMARLSRGRVVEPVQAASILDLFGPSNREKTDRLDESIWDAWYMILLIILVVSAEWVIRKKVGLT